MSRRTFFGTALTFLLLSTLLILSGIELLGADSDDFVLLEGNNVDLYMPKNSSGVNFFEVLTDFEAPKVCDIGYSLLNELVGSVPFSGEKITITAEGYDGEENFPGYAGHAGNPIVVVYDSLSQSNYILSYTPEDGSNALPNFGLYFHEMWHNFQPSEFYNLFPRGYYGEGFARFMANFIHILVINEAQDYGLNQSNVAKMYSNAEWSLGLERGLDPETADFETSSHIFASAFLHEVANDFEDYGKYVFTSFFTLMNEAHELFNVQTDVEINSLFIAMIDSAAYSDYRSLFEYYTFEIDDSLYDSYKEILIPFLLAPPPEPTEPEVRDFDVTFEETVYVVRTCSNSSVSDLTFNQALKRIRFSVDGTTGTAGFCNITIPAELLSGDFTVFKDDTPLIEGVDYTETFNGTHHTLSIMYEHSSHIIEVVGTSVIPESAEWLFLTFVMLATLLVLAFRKKPNRTKKLSSTTR